mgnify:CR=1 FL=1
MWATYAWMKGTHSLQGACWIDACTTATSMSCFACTMSCTVLGPSSYTKVPLVVAITTTCLPTTTCNHSHRLRPPSQLRPTSPASGCRLNRRPPAAWSLPEEEAVKSGLPALVPGGVRLMI